MKRSIPLVLILGSVLVLAGCLGGSGVGTTTNSFPQSSAASNRPGEPGVPVYQAGSCVGSFQEPAFASGASVRNWTGGVPGDVAKYELHVGSYHGGIYLAPWSGSTYKVEVATVNAPGGLLPTLVSNATKNGVFYLNVTVGAPVGLPSLGSGADPMSQVKVWVPQRAWTHVVLSTSPTADLATTVPSSASPTWPVMVQGIYGGPLEITAPRVGANVTGITMSSVDVDAAGAPVNVDGANGAYDVAVNATAACLSSVTSANLHLTLSSGQGFHLDGVRSVHAWISGSASNLTVERSVLRNLDLSLTSSAVTLDHLGFESASIQDASGNVNATLVPLASGVLNITAANVAVTLPAGHGYGVSALLTSSSGKAEAHLANGSAQKTDGGLQATSDGFKQASIQTTATLHGDANVVLRTLASLVSAPASSS